jgi:hypothetical protein
LINFARQGAAEWLVNANIDVAHPPSDEEKWDLEALVRQVR